MLLCGYNSIQLKKPIRHEKAYTTKLGAMRHYLTHYFELRGTHAVVAAVVRIPGTFVVDLLWSSAGF